MSIPSILPASVSPFRSPAKRVSAQSPCASVSSANCCIRSKTSGSDTLAPPICVDGDFQKYVVEPGSYTRTHFFGKYPELLEMVNHLTDEQVRKLLRGGGCGSKLTDFYQSSDRAADDLILQGVGAISLELADQLALIQ